MRKTAVWGAGILLVAGWLRPAQAVEIARWNSSNSVPLAGTYAPISIHTNITASNLVASSALRRDGSSPAANTFAAASYAASTSNDAATSNHYWETVITPNSGYSISFNTITYRFRRANSGPQWAQWAYSTNGVNFVWLLPAGSNTTGYVDKETPLTGIPALTNTTGRIWFRMYAWAGGSANTAWGAYGQNADVLTFSGTIGSAGPVLPSVFFNPAGTTNAPVSNQFTMAVSISPAGAGMQSWSMTPAYAGPASLTNGNFSFTPAAGDNSKTFTVSVIATNSVGTTTGTATIAVTPYVAPVPVITFSPTGTYSIMATYTQKLGIGISPAGSGIQGWTFLPSNYAGSASLAGTNFTYVSVAADGPSNYTLSVIATNVYGTTTGTAAVAVTQYVPAPPPGSYQVDFEDAAAKTGYTVEDRTLNGRVWSLAETAIGTLDSDRKFGAKSARIRYSTEGLLAAITCQSTLLSNGIGDVSFWYAPFSTQGTNAPVLAVEISDNLVSNWVQMGEVNAGAVTDLTYYAASVAVSTPVYLRIRATSGGTEGRANIDNLVVTPYTAPTGYNAFLLQYNVTPGDPGTAANDDLDGDGFSNTNEFTAGTNPYDEALHP